MPDDELVYVRTLPAEPTTIFACMTEPGHLSAFWGPDGTTTPADGIVVELRAGGRFETLIVNDHDGTTHHMQARFDRVEPPGLLSWSELQTGMSTTATFRAVGPGETELRIVQRHVPEAIRALDARRGFSSSLDRFDRYVRGLDRKAT